MQPSHIKVKSIAFPAKSENTILLNPVGSPVKSNTISVPPIMGEGIKAPDRPTAPITLVELLSIIKPAASTSPP